jgi:hypothetical protein
MTNHEKQLLESAKAQRELVELREQNRLLLGRVDALTALTGHISALEAERDTARENFQREMAMRGECLLEIQRLQDELTRLKPSGPVAEDVRRVRVVVENAHAPGMLTSVMIADGKDTLSRLAAGAQEAEALRARVSALEADNAALLQFAGTVMKATRPWAWLEQRARSVVLQPHPGAALLEEHHHALVRARNEGLETAAALCDREAVRHAATAKGADLSTAAGRQARTLAEERERASGYLADDIRALKDPETAAPAPDALRPLVEALVREMEDAIAHRERPRGGQQVPFFGDFAQAPPSLIARLRWWVRELRSSLGGMP